jgi:hypothetical protein
MIININRGFIPKKKIIQKKIIKKFIYLEEKKISLKKKNF